MSALDSVEGVMRREVGGLPVIAWAGIIGGGIIVGKRLAGGGLFGGGGGGTATPFVDPNLTGYTASGEPASSGSVGAPGRPTYADNAAWRRAALDYLGSVGVSPLDAERAITRYLQGDVLDPSGGTKDQNIINTAVRALGAPPEGVPVPTTQPPTTPVPGAVRGARSTRVLAPYGLGENLNQVATRIRLAKSKGGEGVPTTPDGRPLTGAYLASANGLKVSVLRPLRAGTIIAY